MTEPRTPYTTATDPMPLEHIDTYLDLAILQAPEDGSLWTIGLATLRCILTSSTPGGRSGPTTRSAEPLTGALRVSYNVYCERRRKHGQATMLAPNGYAVAGAGMIVSKPTENPMREL